MIAKAAPWEPTPQIFFSLSSFMPVWKDCPSGKTARQERLGGEGRGEEGFQWRCMTKAGNDGEKGHPKGLITAKFARNITLPWTSPFRAIPLRDIVTPAQKSN
jgi:hypothetical protein